MRLKIGTRGSKLALWQAEWAGDLLNIAFPDSALLPITTTGDVIQDRPLHQIGQVGLFTHALDEALLSGTVDVAIHSAKDLPSELPDELELIAALKRENPRDAVLSASPAMRLENAGVSLKLGTSSVRRRALLLHYFPMHRLADIRGNVDSRLKKLEAGEYDALILALAGVRRLGLEKWVVQTLNPGSFTPAVGQGIVAAVCRKDHPLKKEIHQALNHQNSFTELLAERGFLRTIEGGCNTPAFGLATVVGDSISMTAGIAEDDGSMIYRETRDGSVEQAEALGVALAQKIISQRKSGSGIAAVTTYKA